MSCGGDFCALSITAVALSHLNARFGTGRFGSNHPAAVFVGMILIKFHTDKTAVDRITFGTGFDIPYSIAVIHDANLLGRLEGSPRLAVNGTERRYLVDCRTVVPLVFKSSAVGRFGIRKESKLVLAYFNTAVRHLVVDYRLFRPCPVGGDRKKAEQHRYQQ